MLLVLSLPPAAASVSAWRYSMGAWFSEVISSSIFLQNRSWDSSSQRSLFSWLKRVGILKKDY